LNVEFADNNIQKLTISDITGNRIIEKTLIEQNETIDISGLASGIYIIGIQTDNEILTIKIIKELQDMGAKIHACDPVAIKNAKNKLNDVVFFENPYETIRNCDALIVATEWNEFRNLDMRAVKILLKNPIVIDGRNIYDPNEMKELGFTYMGIGR
ncbi:MAG: T9SS type A sorting domain-containing protein, partial [Desulfobacterales bacterium]